MPWLLVTAVIRAGFWAAEPGVQSCIPGAHPAWSSRQWRVQQLTALLSTLCHESVGNNPPFQSSMSIKLLRCWPAALSTVTISYSHCHPLLSPCRKMPISRNVYSLNTKVENPAYNPSLSGNTHVHLRLLHTAAGEVQKLICWFPIKMISTCESVTRCRVLFEVTAREMELQISKFNET